jgi:Mlc titration factor MtfA (ptsG expression regulator)
VFKRRGRRLPSDWQRIAEAHLADWPALSTDEREWIEAATAHLLGTRRWEAARGFELTDEMCTVIALQIALVCLGFDEGLDPVDALQTIIVHPRTITLEGTHHEGGGMLTDEPRELSGEAHDGRGPLLLSWSAVRRETKSRRGRRNVVIHEVAHKLDMVDGVIDGTPPISDADLLQRWTSVATSTYRALRYRGDDLIDDYGGTSASEFFAVVSELFFSRPADMREAHPALYACCRDFYRQDPATRRGRIAQQAEQSQQ